MEAQLQSTGNLVEGVQTVAGTQSEKMFEITQQNDHLNEKERVFVIKIVVSAQMRTLMQILQNSKKDRLKRLQIKQKTPDIQLCKQKYEQFTKLDAKSKQQYRRRNEQNARQLAEYELHLQLKQKYSFPIFQQFHMRGKSPHIKYFYSPEKKFLVIKINKRYFLSDLHLSHKELFNTAISFTRTWNIDFYLMIKVLWKLYGELEKSNNFTVYIRSLDLISVTFDVQYMDKRIYRFRYSPFQFKLIPNFKQDNQLTGYFQTLSCVPEVGSTKGAIVDSDFYNNNRLFFLDDLTDNNIFYKIFNRCNIFYQVYSLSKGNLSLTQGSILEPDQFFKKCHGYFYFSTTRLKKFIFTWAFKQYRRYIFRKKEESEPKEIVFHTAFYFDVERQCKENHPVQQSFYRLKLQLLDASHIVAYAVKQQIALRVREWYLLFKEVSSNRERSAHEQEKTYRRHQVRGDPKEKQEQDDFQISFSFGPKDRLDKFFIGFIVIVSTVLDRNFFSIGQQKSKRQQVKTIRLQTQQTVFCNKKHQHIKHYHSLHVVFSHYFLSHMGQTSARRDQKNALESYLMGKGDFRIKSGGWGLEKVVKVKRKINIKNDKELPEVQDSEVLSWSETFRNYIGILTRHFPLRVIYNDILHFVEQIGRTCYGGQEDTNAFQLNKVQWCYRALIAGLINYYYYSQFKQKLVPKQDKVILEVKDDSRAKIQAEKAKYREERLEDTATRVIVIHILTKGNVGFMAQDKLMAEITFRVMQFRQIWQTTIKEGYIVLRLFEDRVDFEKEYVVVHSLKYDRTRKSIDEQAVRMGLQKCSKDLRASLIL